MAFSKRLRLLACSIAGGAAISPTVGHAAATEAPVELRADAGEWVMVGGFGRNRPVTLRFNAPVFPRLTVPVLEIRCDQAGRGKIELSGLLPSQSFPQPEMSLRIGSAELNETANATYVARKPDGRPVPGNPPYAKVWIESRLTSAFLAQLKGGTEVIGRFGDQERRFPAIPSELAVPFSIACGAMPPDPPEVLTSTIPV